MNYKTQEDEQVDLPLIQNTEVVLIDIRTGETQETNPSSKHQQLAQPKKDNMNSSIQLAQLQEITAASDAENPGVVNTETASAAPNAENPGVANTEQASAAIKYYAVGHLAECILLVSSSQYGYILGAIVSFMTMEILDGNLFVRRRQQMCLTLCFMWWLQALSAYRLVLICKGQVEMPELYAIVCLFDLYYSYLCRLYYAALAGVVVV